jgi:transcriptional regulator with XRE-family HTH domain
MPVRSDWKLDEKAQHRATLQVVEEIARRRISRRHLADLARISLSTLEKVLSGRRPLTLSTLVRLEEALGQSLRGAAANVDEAATSSAHNGKANGAANPAASGLAPDELGSYARPAVQWIEGRYLTIRPSFGNPNAVYAYATEIVWDEAASILTFRETERTDREFTQFGTVAVPHQSGHLYLVTNRHGQYRIIIVSRPTITGEMHGVLSTLKVGRGSQLTPVAAPIALVPMRDGARPPVFGQIAPGHQAYDGYRALLRRTTDEGFVEMLSLATHGG